MSDTRPALVAPQSAGRPVPPILEAVLSRPGDFDAEVWHVMNQRDTRLIEDEILHGAGSSKFVYNFRVAGTQVLGISVIGARHLAAHYGGLHHRVIASTRKKGELHIFTTYPQPGVPMHVSSQVLRDLASEPDYYAALVEIEDIKMGNKVQMEAMESILGTSTDQKTGEIRTYLKLHYDKIAQAKAYRNAVLALIPQDVQMIWKAKMAELGKDEVITIDVIGQKRDGVLRYAARSAVMIDREAVAALTFEQIAGLSDAAKDGQLPMFINAAEALGVLRRATAAEPQRTITQTNQQQPAPATPGPQQQPAKAPETQQRPAETGQQRPADEKPATRRGRPSNAAKEAARQNGQPDDGGGAEGGGPPAGHPANGDDADRNQRAPAAAAVTQAPATAPAGQTAPAKAQQAAMELPAAAGQTQPSQGQPEPTSPSNAAPPATTAGVRENNVQPLRAAAEGASPLAETAFDRDKRMADAIIADYRAATTVQEIVDLNADPVVQQSMLAINSRNPGIYDQILAARSGRMLQIRAETP